MAWLVKLNYQDIGDLQTSDPDDIRRAVIVPAKEALRQLRYATGGNLTIGDNMYAAIITFGAGSQTLTSGTEYIFQNPLKTKPVGFSPIRCVNTSGTALAVGSMVPINTARADGLMGVTLEMLTLGGIGDVCELIGPISRTLSNALPLTSAVVANVGTTTSLTLTPGEWQISGAVGITFAAGASITDFVAAVSKTSATLPTANAIAFPIAGEVRIENQTAAQVPGAGTVQSVALPPYRISVASGATLPLFLIVDVVATVATVSAFGWLEARRMSRINNGVTGIITGILWGG